MDVVHDFVALVELLNERKVHFLSPYDILIPKPKVNGRWEEGHIERTEH